MNTAGVRLRLADPKTSEASKGPDWLPTLIANDFMSRMGGRYDDAHPY
jgi:hypothetical protein